MKPTPSILAARLTALVAANDVSATQIWRRHAHRREVELPGVAQVPLYRCFKPRQGKLVAPPGFHQLTADILFLGINPAAPAARLDFLPADFEWSRRLRVKPRLPRLREYEWHAEGNYLRHFKPYEDLSERLGLKGRWAHLDMFLTRETSQKNLEAVLHEVRDGRRVLHPFFAEQFEQFRRTLLAHEPRVVVVANRRASRIVQQGLGLLTLHSDQAGNHICQWNERPGIPIVLAPVLTPGRCKPEARDAIDAIVARALDQ